MSPFNPDIEALLSLILGTLLTSGVMALIGGGIVMLRKTCALYDAHLGPNAIDAETGIPRWYEPRHDAAFKNLADAFREESRANREVIGQNTKVMEALLSEIRVDREVGRLVEERVKAIQLREQDLAGGA